MFETYYGAGYGYGYDISDAEVVGVPGGYNHTHFLFWTVLIALAAVGVLGGLKVYGFHFVVRT